MRSHTPPCLAAALAVALPAASAPGAPAGADPVIEVIFSEVPGHPTAVVPGARNLAGDPVFAEFISIDSMGFHPDGSAWVLRARNSLGNDLQATLVRGAGTTGSVFAQEGQPLDGGAAGEIYNFFGLSAPSFNDLGQIGFTAVARGGISTRATKGMFFDGVTIQVVREQGDAALGMIDDPPGDSGDEIFGPNFGSFHVQNDGTFGFLDRTVANIAVTRRHGVFYGDTAFRQIGVSTIDGGTWEVFDSNHFWTTPDGTAWMVRGSDDSPISQDQILVVNDAVVLRQGQPVDGSAWNMGEIFFARLHPGGDVFVRGDREDNGDWATVNADLLTTSGDPTGDGDETLAARFFAVAGNRHGDWAVAAETDRADPATDHVIIFNGAEVVVREGDPVDLNGDGLPNDDAFIGRGDPALPPFRSDLLDLTDDGVLFFIASLRDAAGNDLGPGGGDAFLRVVLAPCPADVNGSGAVDFVDLLALLGAWGPCGGCPEDIDGSGTVDFIDILEVLSAWGPCA